MMRPDSAFAEHLDAAVAYAFARLVERHPDEVAAWNARQRARWREELTFHWEVLGSAVEVDEPSQFTRYVHWASAVQASRGVPRMRMVDTLADLEAYAGRSLPEPVGWAAADTLARSRHELAADGTRMDLGSTPFEPPSRVASPGFTQWLLDGEVERAWDEVADWMEWEDGYARVAVGAVQPALYEVGRLWQSHRVSVAQEHLAAVQASVLLTRAFAAASKAPPHARRGLFAAVEGNRHALGSRMLGDVFALGGWQVQELGADVPTDDLVSQIDRFGPHVVALSASLPQHVGVVREAVERVRTAFAGRRPDVLVGGLPFNQVEGLADRVGADAWYPDARAARADAA